MSIPVNRILAKLPVAKLADSLTRFVEPLVSLLPDERLRKVVPLAVQCILSCQTPVIAAMARAYSDEIDHVFRPCRPPVGAKRR